MANKYKGEVSIEFDGKVYVMCFPMNAIVELEDRTGKSFFKLLDEVTNGEFSMKTIRTFIWAGLHTRHPEFDEAGIGKLIDEVGLPEFLEKMNEVFTRTFPDASKGGDEAANPLTLGNGKGSIASS